MFPDLNEWALDLATGGGRFNLVRSSTYTPTSRKGKQRVLSCYRAIKAKLTNEKRNTITQRCNCPYSIRLEECIEGWAVVTGYFAHNHDLVESHSASLAESTLRQIPFEFNTLGFELKRAGLTASKINQVFISKAHEKHLPITWSYQDVYNKFQPSVEERGFDATNFVSYLQEQLSTKGLYFAIQTAEDSSMSKVFWTLTDSFERWVENSEANIVVFDTTHGTNKYTLKFTAFCPVNKHGNTQVLA
ncbi:putative far-red impaired response protein [Oopsacas minuta]|uniref:Far-red impaired response protein n=1 Tax=Oopsacas minuta TaxID=111878 RepID=A0AAV7JSW8_9METZ|nr:putative far-red impaired response protein [Oopsacas minuta]